MPSSLYQKQNDDPHDVLVVAPDVVLVAPTDEELSRLAQTMRHPPNPPNPPPRAGSDLPAGPTVPLVDTTFRPAISDVEIPGRGRAIGGRAARALTTALLLALSAGAAAFAWQSYGDEAKAMMAQWVPQRVLAALLPLEKPALAAPPTAVETATADTTPAQPAPPAAPPAAAPTAAAASGKPAGPPRSTAPDLAAMGQEIEQLKASIEQLKADQQQMSREIAKASEASEAKGSEAKASTQNLRPRMSALPPRPAAARARKPMPPVAPPPAAAYPALPAQAAAPYAPQPIQPPAPATTQTLADPELASVPRPPMPLR